MQCYFSSLNKKLEWNFRHGTPMTQHTSMFVPKYCTALAQMAYNYKLQILWSRNLDGWEHIYLQKSWPVCTCRYRTWRVEFLQKQGKEEKNKKQDEKRMKANNNTMLSNSLQREYNLHQTDNQFLSGLRHVQKSPSYMHTNWRNRLWFSLIYFYAFGIRK